VLDRGLDNIARTHREGVVEVVVFSSARGHEAPVAEAVGVDLHQQVAHAHLMRVDRGREGGREGGSGPGREVRGGGR